MTAERFGEDREDGELLFALSTASSTAPAPLCIDLFCGLGGWTEGFLSEAFDVIGFDIEQHVYGEHRYPGQLVIQDVRTLHGSQFKDAWIIVASSPCQEFSYRAMPWKRAKALGPPVLGMELFAQAARIQKEACEAASRYIPMIQENVCGAQPWVGKAQWHHGSFYLWGDVPALMPVVSSRRMKSQIGCSPRLFKDRIASTPDEAHALHYRMPSSVAGPRPNGGRKGASAKIAKIPFPLAQHIARVTRESRKVA